MYADETLLLLGHLYVHVLFSFLSSLLFTVGWSSRGKLGGLSSLNAVPHHGRRSPWLSSEDGKRVEEEQKEEEQR